jgi:hypothetical protein
LKHGASLHYATPGREVAVEGDIKEVIGVLMRVLAGGEISRGEVEDLAFEAEGELQAAVNEAYIKLLEFAYDRDARGNDHALDRQMRSALQQSLDEIVRLADPSISHGAPVISGLNGGRAVMRSRVN